MPWTDFDDPEQARVLKRLPLQHHGAASLYLSEVNVEVDPAKPTNRSTLLPPGKEGDLAIHTGLSVNSERCVKSYREADTPIRCIDRRCCSHNGLSFFDLLTFVVLRVVATYRGTVHVVRGRVFAASRYDQLVTIQYYWHFSYHQSCWALLRYHLVKPFLLDKTPLLLLLDSSTPTRNANGKR